MPATKKDVHQRGVRAATKVKAEAAAADEPSRSDARASKSGPPRGEGRADRQRAGGSREPRRVKAREASRRISELADVSESLDGRRRLRRLARLVARGSRDVRGIGFIETLLGECLDDVERDVPPRERWRTCEAASWGLAWLARTRRAGGSAGGLLERLVKHARAGCHDLRERDTSAARFVMVLARLFCDIEACRCLEGDAVAAVAEELGRLVSDDGAVTLAGDPPGSAAVIERVERWSGVREVAAVAGGPRPWDEAAEKRWRRATITALRLLGGQGRMLAGAGRLPASCSRRLLEAARDGKGRAARTAKSVSKPPRTLDQRTAKRLLPRDLHAADAALAVIRTGWHRDAVRVLVDYRTSVPRLEIAANDRLLVEGPWSWRVVLGGRTLEAEGPWTVTGFESDRKATFLEIAAPLGGGLQIERQVVVLVRDAVVLLADAVTAATPPAGTTLEIETDIVLGQALEAEPADETRDVVVYDTAMRLMALPLALPEWTAGRCDGTFEAKGGRLRLRHATQGGRLYAPLWLDCDPARIGRPLTWRQLTVADTRRNLPRHQAAGFRVQSGQDQWLVYRALDVPRNRTVLGCNLSCEFLAGRIRADGTVARTLEIE